MSDVIMKLEGLAGEPTLRIDMEEGTVFGLDEILPLLTNVHQAEMVASILNSTGETFEADGNRLAACPAYEAAARVMGSIGDAFNQAAFLNNLGLAQKRAGEPDQAADSYGQAVALLERPMANPAYEHARFGALATSLINLAILAHERGDQPSMRRYGAWVLRIATGKSDPICQNALEQCRRLGLV